MERTGEAIIRSLGWRAIWPFLPIVALIVAIPLGAAAFVFVFFFVYPGHILWCAIGAVCSLTLAPRDQRAFKLNVVTALPSIALLVAFGTNGILFHI